MDDTWTLLLLSLAMLIGCYVAGAVPLAFTLSEERLRQVTVLGAGLLVGTALAVIIPEGVHTMYDAHSSKQVSSPSANVDIVAKDVAEGIHSHTEHSHGSTEMHTWIGMALVLGFIFMLLVDQIGGRGLGHSHVPTVDTEGGSPVMMNRNKITATLGLVVHAAADGIALGAAASTSQTHVEMIVFIAIMLHKAPAAFGLVSFLMHEGLDRNRIRKHLAIFAAAAPIGAILTYFGISQSSKESLAHLNVTGIAMLFSGGTFLYVATVHILPELESMGSSRTVLADGSVITKEQKGFSKLELCLMVLGSILPLMLSLGHHH